MSDKRLRATRGTVLVEDLQIGERMVGNIYIPNDDGKAEGIRSRWCKVYAVGDDITDIQPGKWILVKHARWTRGMTVEFPDGDTIKLWAVEYPESCMLVADEPVGTTFSDYTTGKA